jgi:transposase
MTLATITRQFSLIPIDEKGELLRGIAKKPIYKRFTDAFVKVRELKNTYIKLLVPAIREGEVEPFQNTGKASAKGMYDEKQFRTKKSPAFRSWELKERIKRPAFYEAYDIVRNWIVRNEWLKVLSGELVKKIREDSSFQEKFLKGKRFFYSELKELLAVLKDNRFGSSFNANNKGPSTHELNNLIFQLRNIFLNEHDFPSPLLFTPSVSLNPFQEHVRSLFLDLKFSEVLGIKVTSGFLRKKKGKLEPIPEHELIEYWLTQYFRTISTITTKKTNKFYSNRDVIQTLKKMRVKTKKQQVQLAELRAENERIVKFIEQRVGTLSFASIKEFQKAREFELSLRKDAILKNLAPVSLQDLIKEAFAEELNAYREEGTHLVLRKLFKPTRLRYKIAETSASSFIEFFKTQLRNKIRELTKEEFFTETFVSLFSEALVSIGRDIYSHVNAPNCKRLSVSQTAKDEKIFVSTLLGNDLEALDCTCLTAKIGFQARKFMSVKIIDAKKFTIDGEKVRISRIDGLLNEGFTPLNPTLTLSHRKLIAHLPFEQKKGEESKPTHASSKKEREMGVDLGLLHFGVASVQDVLKKEEIAHYFLGARELFDSKFDDTNGTLIPQDRFQNSKTRIRSDIKQKIVNLRGEIKHIQRKLNESKNFIDRIYQEFKEVLSQMDASGFSRLTSSKNYKFWNYMFNNKEMRKLKTILLKIKATPERKEEILARFTPNHRHKQEVNRLTRVLSLLWNKVNKYNQQIIQLVSHFIVKIALYHEASVVKMEDLKWSLHSKKKEAGAFLAFWQAPWFQSGVQEAVRTRCLLHGIKFKRVPARFTSQQCSRCGKIGNRDGKRFSCPLCGLTLDSDLNAARNICQYMPPSDNDITLIT